MHSFKKIALWGISIASIGFAFHAKATITVTGNEYEYSFNFTAQAVDESEPPMPIPDTYIAFTEDPGPSVESVESLFIRVTGTTADTVSVDLGDQIVVDFSGTETPGYYTSNDSSAIARFAEFSVEGGGIIVRASGLTGFVSIGYISVPGPLAIELVSYDGTNLVVNVTGGLPDKTYKITSSTDLTLPFADTGVTFDAASATGISVPSGSNTRFFVRAEEVPSGT